MYENHTLIGISEQKVMELFLGLERHYFAEIARKTNLTRPRTMRALRKLVEAGILQIKAEANVKYYYLTRSPLAYAVLGIVEYNRTAAFLERNKTLKRALEMFSSGYRDHLIMLVFGSYAKGYASKSSDIDLLLAKEDFQKTEIKMIEELAGTVNGRTGLKISPYMMKTGELRQKKDFVKEIMDNHILLEGAELFFRLVME